MKELKHLIYFENLLEDANNELVRKAEAEGDLAIGYTCFHAPEVLLNLGNCFSVRLRAPHTNSMELATYYMANNSCEFSRALLERALEGNYSFLHAMAGVDVCEAKFYSDIYVMDKEAHLALVRRENAVGECLSRKEVIQHVLLTTYGLKENEYSDDYSSVLTLDDLF